MHAIEQRATITMLRLGFAAIGIALIAGLLSVLYYIPIVAQGFQAVGISMATLRPLHTTFAHLWIFAANIAFLYHFLSRQKPDGFDAGDHRRFRFHTVCWVVAGAGIIVTLLFGVTSGREYLGFHPAFSAVFFVGWVALAWTFFRSVLPGFWNRPVYVYMWSIGILYFMYTFVEAHAYMLPFVNRYPIVDLQIQWKASGTLVGSFNFLVYGSLMYLSALISGDDSYAQSKVAFWLFGVGCLNSFTNFGHHTYHLPQTHAVKWISFVVSMTEIIIVLRVLFDIVGMLKKRVSGTAHAAVTMFINSARGWTLAMVLGGVIISIPSWNSIIHGTHVIVAHAMGAELGIDSMVLFAVVSFLLMGLYDGRSDVAVRINGNGLRTNVIMLNVAIALLVVWLTLYGVVTGITQYYGWPEPGWFSLAPFVFAVAGILLFISLGRLLDRWTPLVFNMRLPAATASDAARPDAA